MMRPNQLTGGYTGGNAPALRTTMIEMVPRGRAYTARGRYFAGWRELMTRPAEPRSQKPGKVYGTLSVGQPVQ